MPSSKEAIKAVWPLRLIFFGALLCIFDYLPAGLRGPRYQVDVLNDALGMFLIAVAAGRLARIPVHPPWNDHHGSAMRFVKYVALIGIAEAVVGHLTFERPPPLVLAVLIYRIALVGASVLLCMAMRWLCSELGLRRALKSWTVTTVAFVAVFASPLAAMYVTDFLTIMAGKKPFRALGPAELLARVILSMGFVLIFVSTSRMEREASGEATDASRQGS